MAIAPREKVGALVEELGSQAELARLMGVDRATVSRWRNGAPIDYENARSLDALLYVLAEARRVFGPRGALRWLHGVDAHLGNRSPAFVLGLGRVDLVVGALRSHEAGSYA
jgi:hypothetical protein